MAANTPLTDLIKERMGPGFEKNPKRAGQMYDQLAVAALHRPDAGEDRGMLYVDVDANHGPSYGVSVGGAGDVGRRRGRTEDDRSGTTSISTDSSRCSSSACPGSDAVAKRQRHEKRKDPDGQATEASQLSAARTSISTTFSDRFPKAGETIFGDHFDLGWGGKGANQAVAARLCGADVVMVARVGDDLFGPATIENFEVAGHRRLPRHDRPGDRRAASRRSSSNRTARTASSSSRGPTIA